MRINKRHNSTSKVGRVQRILRHSRQGLPRNQRLGTSHSAGQAALVVDRPNTVVLDQRRGTVQSKSVRRAVPPAVSRRANRDDVAGRGARRAGQPDNHSLPVVTVAKACGGLVLGHVPCVHYAVVIAVGGAAGVDLTRAAAAPAVGGAGWFEASAG